MHDAHAVAHGHPHAVGAAGVDGHEGAVPLGLAHGGVDHGVVHVRLLGGVGGHDPVARDHELDRAHTQVALLPHGAAGLLGAVDLAEVAGADGAPLRQHLPRRPQAGAVDEAALDGARPR